MANLLLLKYQAEEDARSPEFRYLLSLCVARMRGVFGSVEQVLWDGRSTEPAPPGRSDYVLVLGRENVYLSPASLRRMKERVDRGAGVALPRPLSSFPIIEEIPIYSLRGYEAVERRILDEGHPPRESSRSHLPVSLFSGATFERHAARLPLATLLTDPAVLQGWIPDDEESAGIFHEFVDYYGELRQDVLPYLPDRVQDVLEIGCGRGLTGALIAERRGCRVTGIELNPIIAQEAATRLRRVIVGDVLEVEIPGSYDAVVATELFEHLTYPEPFLARMKSVLRPGGRIVLSVPNVGHYSVVEDLLAGRWDYLPIGLMCYTHFRFFTRSTLEDWIARAEFSSWEIIPQTTELPEHLRELPSSLPVDLESLGTKGFYVILTA